MIGGVLKIEADICGNKEEKSAVLKNIDFSFEDIRDLENSTASNISLNRYIKAAVLVVGKAIIFVQILN